MKLKYHGTVLDIDYVKNPCFTFLDQKYPNSFNQEGCSIRKCRTSDRSPRCLGPLNLVKKYSDLAIKSINDLNVNQSNKKELIDLSQLLLTRKFFTAN